MPEVRAELGVSSPYLLCTIEALVFQLFTVMPTSLRSLGGEQLLISPFYIAFEINECFGACDRIPGNKLWANDNDVMLCKTWLRLRNSARERRCRTCSESSHPPLSPRTSCTHTLIPSLSRKQVFSKVFIPRVSAHSHFPIQTKTICTKTLNSHNLIHLLQRKIQQITLIHQLLHPLIMPLRIRPNSL